MFWVSASSPNQLWTWALAPPTAFLSVSTLAALKAQRTARIAALRVHLAPSWDSGLQHPSVVPFLEDFLSCEQVLKELVSSSESA